MLAKKLNHLGNTDFTLSFIRRLIDAIKLAVEHVNVPFDCDSNDSTNQFKTRMQRRIKRYKLDDDHEFDWIMDPGEKVCKSGCGGERAFLMATSSHATRKHSGLYSLRKSSRAAERVFSCLKLIRDTCVDNSLKI